MSRARSFSCQRDGTVCHGAQIADARQAVTPKGNAHDRLKGRVLKGIQKSSSHA